ncbi:hypothetical protein [Pantoea ananatis]|uniref:hypothetical protein n=1 Tax=Pantoea ananas TaxID=553 RepID=UPI001B315D43|nr:hypothetical protein [Pantoea ananatis]
MTGKTAGIKKTVTEITKLILGLILFFFLFCVLKSATSGLGLTKYRKGHLREYGTLALVKPDCHFFGVDDLSVLVLKSGEVATVDGCVRAESGTAVQKPEYNLTLSGDEAARTWCIDGTCYFERDPH